MKKAILGTGIGWAILCGVTAIICFALAPHATDPTVIDAAMQSGTQATRAQLEQAAQYLQIALYISGAWTVVGMIFSIVLIALRNSSMGKGGGITLGVFGIICGATLPAVFFLVDSAVTRK